MFTLFLHVSILCAAIPQAEMQRESIARLLDLKDFSKAELVLLRQMKLIQRGDTKAAADVCKWTGVTCASGVVIALDWSMRIDVRWLRIDWMPATVTRARFHGVKIAGYFDGARLPRSLENLNARKNNWCGRVIMCELPRRMEYFEVPFNSLSGTVHLVDLPPNIVKINFSNTDVAMVVVDNGALPPSLGWAGFFDMGKGFRCVSVDGSGVDPRVETGRSRR